MAPLPSIVMSLAIGGSPLGPYQLLSTPVRRYTHPAPSGRCPAPARLLALLIADTSEAGSPVVPEHAAVNGAASAGAAQSDERDQARRDSPRHHGDTQTA